MGSLVVNKSPSTFQRVGVITEHGAQKTLGISPVLIPHCYFPVFWQITATFQGVLQNLA